MQTDNTQETAGITPPPIPPLAPIPPFAASEKSSSNPTKSGKATGKAKVLRKLSAKEIAEYADRMVEDAKAGDFPDKMIPVGQWAKKMNISRMVVDKIFIRSRLQKEDFELHYGTVSSATDSCPYIDRRGMIMIPHSAIIAYNKAVPIDQQYATGQRFSVTFEDNRIILTRAS